jgi:hypothetical protein
MDTTIELNVGGRYGLLGANGSGTFTTAKQAKIEYATLTSTRVRSFDSYVRHPDATSFT